MLWAGDLKKNEKRRVAWTVDHGDFHPAMECGMIPATPAVPAARETILAWRFFCLTPMIGRFMFARLAVILSTLRET